MRKKLLIADDEHDLTKMLQTFFIGKGYDVMTAYSGRETVEKAQKNPDIILLDVNMPDIDGFSVCGRIRDFVTCPIVFLTAKTQEADKIQGFSAGGDDYIVKPFSIVELEHRVSAHLRRETRSKETCHVKFAGAVSIDYQQKKLFYEAQPIPLAKKDFAIIEFLSLNSRQVFDKERIYEAVWGYDSEGSSTVVAEHIRKIRSVLAEYGYDHLIETIWGVGYRWNQ